MILYLVTVVALAIAASDAGAGLTGIVDTKILGAFHTPIDRFPHTVSVRAIDRHICNGVVVSPKHVVTSAACVKIVPSSVPLVVHAGSSTRLKGGWLYKTDKVDVSPHFNATNGDCDVAVLTLSSAIDFSMATRMIDLSPKKDAPRLDDKMTITGWGPKTENDGDNVDEWLQMAELQYFDFASCRIFYEWYKLQVTKNMFCAGTGNWGGGAATYEGDRGSPLIKNGKLVGIASWGLPQGPSVFTDITSQCVNSFITSFIKK